MNCNTINIGCLSLCETLETGLIATQTGMHIFKFKYGSSCLTTNANYTIGDEFELTSSGLNENAHYTLTIINPDGSTFADLNGNTKFTFKTEVCNAI